MCGRYAWGWCKHFKQVAASSTGRCQKLLCEVSRHAPNTPAVCRWCCSHACQLPQHHIPWQMQTSGACVSSSSNMLACPVYYMLMLYLVYAHRQQQQQLLRVAPACSG